MRVWRVENAVTGKGPYCYARDNEALQVLSDVMSYEHSDRPGRPGIMSDVDYSGLRWEDWYCGCPGLRALAWWFYGYLKGLRQAGAVVIEYEVDPAHVLYGKSGRQVLFQRDHAQEVRRFA